MKRKEDEERLSFLLGMRERERDEREEEEEEKCLDFGFALLRMKRRK